MPPRPHPSDLANITEEKGGSSGHNTGNISDHYSSKPQQWNAAPRQDASFQAERNNSGSSAQWQTEKMVDMNAIQQQLDGSISSMVDLDLIGDLFDDSSLIAEEDEELAARHVTDNTDERDNARRGSFLNEDAATINLADWKQLGDSIGTCSNNELGDIRQEQGVFGIQNFEGIEFQDRSESPSMYQDGFFSVDNSPRSGDHIDHDEPSTAAHQDVSDVLLEAPQRKGFATALINLQGDLTEVSTQNSDQGKSYNHGVAFNSIQRSLMSPCSGQGSVQQTSASSNPNPTRQGGVDIPFNSMISSSTQNHASFMPRRSPANQTNGATYGNIHPPTSLNNQVPHSSMQTSTSRNNQAACNSMMFSDQNRNAAHHPTHKSMNQGQTILNQVQMLTQPKHSHALSSPQRTPQVQRCWDCNNHPKSIESNDTLPLLQWIEMETRRASQDTKRSVLRKLSVAYGIGKLLQSSQPAKERCTSENFAVREVSLSSSMNRTNVGWEVEGVIMIDPPLSVQLVSSAGSTNTDLLVSSSQHRENAVEPNSSDGIVGRDVSAIIMDTYPPVMQEAPGDEMQLCRAFGELLHFLFSEEEVQDKGHQDEGDINDAMALTQPSKRQTRVSSFSQASIYSESHCADAKISNDGQSEHKDSLKFPPLIDYGYPPSISLLVRDLLSCGDGLFRSDSAFKSLKEASDEVHLLFQEPTSLLFERAHHEKHLLKMGTKKLFGRSFETATILDAYHRVASTQRSEVVIIGGYSGSGKTRLVNEAVDTVRFSEGYFVERKFEELSTQSCMNVVLSAFDELLFQIAQSKPTELLSTMYSRLASEFGSSFHFLTQMLPNVLLFRSSQQSTQSLNSHSISNANVMSLCFTLQRFMKIISSSVGSLVLFLDDLQWADSTSLGLIHAVLMGLDESKSMLIIGSYRNNDAQNGQLIFKFLDMLSQLNTRLTTIDLDDMPEADVRLMISDALGIVPRLCTTLSAQVHRKTKGSPFFVREFMRTLVERGLVKYSLREKRWLWDVDKIIAEPITDNVLQFITLKIHTLSQRTQEALKIASCFGTKVLSSIVRSLSSTRQYSRLQTDIGNAVEEGFIDFDGMHYCFTHDKVREASYELINDAVRNQFHFEIGMALYESCVAQDDNPSNDILFTTVEQINYGEPSLVDDNSQRLSIVKLNYKAGLSSMKSWNFVGALTYMKAGYSLLPHDSWVTYYDLSINIYYQLAVAAYSCGEIHVAKIALDEIDQKAKCLQDKLDAYNLLVRILQHDQEDLSLALNICCKTLKLLGEDVPYDTKMFAITQIVELGRTRVRSSFISSSDMLRMPRTQCKNTIDIMRFYHQLALVAFLKGNQRTGRERGLLCAYYISRWVRYCLNEKVVCKHTPVALCFYSAALVHDFNERNCQEAYRLGKVALHFLAENEDQNELPGTYLVFYGFVGVLFEPIQACVDMHRKAYMVGMQIGDTSDAILNILFLIPRMIDCGTNLLLVKKEIDFFQQLAKAHSHSVLETYMQWYMDTIFLLCDDTSNSVNISLANSDEYKVADAASIHLVPLMMAAVYLGQLERVMFLAKKWDSLDSDEKNRIPMRISLVSYYHGLASCGLYRRKVENGFYRRKMRGQQYISAVNSSISVLTKATKFSEWNFKAKLSLLLAEKASIQGMNSEAEGHYDAAIKAAKSSKFVHEEALAYELSARYYKKKKMPNIAKAVSLYKEAERCYVEWGSAKKVNQVKEATLLMI